MTFHHCSEKLCCVACLAIRSVLCKRGSLSVQCRSELADQIKRRCLNRVRFSHSQPPSIFTSFTRFYLCKHHLPPPNLPPPTLHLFSNHKLSASNATARTTTWLLAPASRLRNHHSHSPLVALQLTFMSMTNEMVISHIHKRLEKTSDLWLCHSGVWRSQKETGFSNFIQHPEKKHKKELSSICRNYVLKTITFLLSLLYGQKLSIVYDWICSLVSFPQNFFVVEKARLCEHIKYPFISLNICKQYFYCLTRLTEFDVAVIFPGCIALVFDGWTSKIAHYKEVFAAFPAPIAMNLRHSVLQCLRWKRKPLRLQTNILNSCFTCSQYLKRSLTMSWH